MKKYLIAAVTIAAFSGMSFAQPAAAPAAAPARSEKPAPRKEMKKAEVTKGEISAIDAATNEITVKDSKGAEKKFTLEAAKLTGLTQGEKVIVSVKDGKVSLKAIKKHEAKHESKKAGAQKSEAPKTEPGK